MKTITVLLFILLVSGCQYHLPFEIPIPDLPDEELIWVAKHYIGGKQCDPNERYSPPDVTAILNRAGIMVYDTEIAHHAVCRACGCPTYSALHSALISRDDVRRAYRLGFELRSEKE